MSVYETTDFSDDPEAVKEKYGNGAIDVGREFCLRTHVFTPTSFCSQFGYTSFPHHTTCTRGYTFTLAEKGEEERALEHDTYPLEKGQGSKFI